MKKRNILISLVAVLLAATLVYAGTVTKGLIGKQDMALWYSGDSASTFTRSTSEGYTLTLNKLDWVGADAFQVWGGGVNKTRAVLVSAQSDIDTTSTRNLWLAPGTWTIDDDLTFASYPNLFIHMAPGAIFSISTGKTLTLYSPANIIAQPNQQIKSGAGILSFTIPGIEWIEWRGASPNASAATNSTAIQATFNSAAIVRAGAGSFSYDTGLTINGHVKFKGAGVGSGWATADAITRLHYTGAGVGITLGSTAVAEFCELSDFMLSGTVSATGGILAGSTFVMEESTLKNILIRDFTKVGAYGLRCANTVSNIFDNVICNVNYYGLLADTVNTSNVFIKPRFENSTNRGAYIKYMKGTSFYNPVFEASAEAGLLVEAVSADAVRNLTFHNPWFEANNTTHATDDAEMVITGSGGFHAYNVNVYNPHFEAPGHTYLIRLGFAAFCAIYNPRRWLADDIIVTGGNATYCTILDRSSLSISGQTNIRLRTIPEPFPLTGGTFTCANNTNTVVANVSVTAASLIFIMPTNAAAATLMGAATSLYISAKVVEASFTVTTANAGAAAGTETFNYLIIN